MRRTAGLVLSLCTSLATLGCLHAPMPWSPDGKWIAYTMEVRPVERLLRPGWLFGPLSAAGFANLNPGRPSAYRLWASRRDSGDSVLLEESDQPISAPGWSPDGRALAFGRLVLQGNGTSRFEVVILENSSRRRILSSRALGEIGAEAARLPGQAVAWSPDGRFLAVPQLNPPGLAILRADNGRQVNAINDGFLPSWSPDGSRLAFFMRGTGDTLNCLDTPLGQPRMLLEVGQGSQAPVWTSDGLTLVVVARRSIPKGGEPPLDQAELVRLRVDTGQSETIRDLAGDAMLGRDRSMEGLSIAFDGQRLFCSTVVEGVPQQITWYYPRENAVHKKFPLLDFTIPLGSLSLSPDGTTLAARVGKSDRLGSPVLCDLEDPNLTARLIAPDDSSRVEWIATLVSSAQMILATLPPASMEPKLPSSRPVQRPTILPVPGEFEPHSEPVNRLRKIGRWGRPLCDRPADAPAGDPSVMALYDEARLFFDYLAGNDVAALDDLEILEARLDDPDLRSKLLAVRAQIDMAQGRWDQAGRTIKFLREITRKPSRRVEWVGSSYVLTGSERSTEDAQGWPEYLTSLISKLRINPTVEEHFNPDAPRLNFGLEPFNPRVNPPFPDRPFLNEPVVPREPGDRKMIPPRGRPANR